MQVLVPAPLERSSARVLHHSRAPALEHSSARALECERSSARARALERSSVSAGALEAMPNEAGGRSARAAGMARNSPGARTCGQQERRLCRFPTAVRSSCQCRNGPHTSSPTLQPFSTSPPRTRRRSGRRHAPPRMPHGTENSPHAPADSQPPAKRLERAARAPPAGSGRWAQPATQAGVPEYAREPSLAVASLWLPAAPTEYAPVIAPPSYHPLLIAKRSWGRACDCESTGNQPSGHAVSLVSLSVSCMGGCGPYVQ